MDPSVLGVTTLAEKTQGARPAGYPGVGDQDGSNIEAILRQRFTAAFGLG